MKIQVGSVNMLNFTEIWWFDFDKCWLQANKKMDKKL